MVQNLFLHGVQLFACPIVSTSEMHAGAKKPFDWWGNRFWIKVFPWKGGAQEVQIASNLIFIAPTLLPLERLINHHIYAPGFRWTGHINPDDQTFDHCPQPNARVKLHVWMEGVQGPARGHPADLSEENLLPPRHREIFLYKGNIL